jgi:thiol-disulfide isomerase/thioredoxin
MKTLLKNAVVSAALVLMIGAAGIAGAASRTLDAQTFGDIRARYAGKPLIVHIWGVTCGPCVTELPRWGALQRAHPELNLVLIQADESSPKDAERRLREAGLAKVESWAVASEPDEFLRASIDPRWAGDMPRTLMIGADGSIERVRGTADFASVRRWLDAHGGKRS